MKKIIYYFLVLVFLIFINIPKTEAKVSDAELQNEEIFEEVVLSPPQIEENGDETNVQAAEINENDENMTLRDKLKNVYHLEINEYDRPEYLFRDILTHKCKEESIMDNWHVWGAFNGLVDMSFTDNGNFNTKYMGNAHNIGFDGFLKNNNGDFRIMLGVPYPSGRNYVQTLFSDVYFGTNKIPHHRIQIGHFRPQIGMEGGNSAYTLAFLGRSQIARNFGTARRIGGRIKGDFKYLDYDAGVYSSDTFFEEFFPGAEFVGWINLKPLANVEDKYGKLKIGGGIDGGHRDDNFFVTGAYVGYEYKKFMAEFEWANANGYNGYYGHSRKHATGFYTTIGYMLTKKLQLLACYDEFTPDKTISGNKKREYTLGINYFIKGQALRLILNYVFCQNDNTKDSHRIMLGTKILI